MKRSEPDHTGIPAQLKANLEHTTGIGFDDVRVHYNSDMPFKVGALAYTQGNEVHIGSGQEKHLPHELGHVVQQKMGRVRPNIEYPGGLKLNTDEALEREADEIGAGKYIDGKGSDWNSVEVIQRMPPRGPGGVSANPHNWGDMSTLNDHFRRHGADVSARDEQDYARIANDFYKNRSSYQKKVDSSGIIRVYDSARNIFGSYNPDGTTRTLFSPSRRQAYFDSQPGS